MYSHCHLEQIYNHDIIIIIVVYQTHIEGENGVIVKDSGVMGMTLRTAQFCYGVKQFDRMDGVVIVRSAPL